MSPSLFATPVYLFGLILAIFVSAFLFWRAGRHELHDSEVLLDLMVFAAFGALFIGRIAEFFINYNLYQLQFERLIYFHVFRGFNWWGGLLGAGFAGYLYLRRSKVNIFSMLDLAVAPIALGQFIYYIAGYARETLLGRGHDFYLISSVVFYFMLFWIVIRFSGKKRQTGAIFGLWLVLQTIFSLAISVARRETYTPVSLGAAAIAVLVWYLLSKRRVKDDINLIFGFFLLLVLRTKRGIASLDDSGRASRFVIFLPYYILQLILVSLRLLAREVRASFFDLMYVWGKRR